MVQVDTHHRQLVPRGSTTVDFRCFTIVDFIVDVESEEPHLQSHDQSPAFGHEGFLICILIAPLRSIRAVVNQPEQSQSHARHLSLAGANHYGLTVLYSRQSKVLERN